MEETTEEQITTQRFDVVIVWSSEDAHVTAERLQDLLAQELHEVDTEATIDVDEIVEPTF